MALVAWFPLNNNWKDQGPYNFVLTQSTAPSFVDGKVTTQALSTGGARMTADQAAMIFNPYEMSFCFWIKPTSTDGTGIIFGNNSMTAPNNRKFSIFQYDNKTKLHLSWQSDTSDSADIVGWASSNNFLETDKWTHIAIVYNYKWNHVKVYKNGILASKPTLKKPYPIDTNFSNTTAVFNNSSLRYLNDFRIYNHALSSVEVKELTKGLACHFTFNFEDFYTQVEYLESDGNQWIDSGVSIQSRTFIISDIMFNDVFNYNMMYGAWSIFAMAVENGNKWCCACGGSSTHNLTRSGDAQTGVKYHIDHEAGIVMIAGSPYRCGTASNTTSSRHILLFAASASGSEPYSWNSYGKGRIYRLKIGTRAPITSAMVLSRDFIPVVRKSDGKPGLYDLIENKFYINQGTGDFNYPNFAQIEYIESDGNQYIDTGIVLDLNTDGFDVKVQSTENLSNNMIIFGVRDYYYLYHYGTYRHSVELWIHTSTGDQELLTGVPESELGSAHSFKYLNKILYCNNTQVASFSGTAATTSQNCYLFDFNNGGSQPSALPYKGRFYYAKFYKNGVLVRDFVPVINLFTKVYGMYDLVEKKFYPSNSNCSFSGPRKNVDVDIVGSVTYNNAVGSLTAAASTGDWHNRGIYTTKPLKTCHIQFYSRNNTNTAVMVGLRNDKQLNYSIADGNWYIDCYYSDGQKQNSQVWIGNSYVASTGAYLPNTRFDIYYDGHEINFYKAGVWYYTVETSGEKYAFIEVYSNRPADLRNIIIEENTINYSDYLPDCGGYSLGAKSNNVDTSVNTVWGNLTATFNGNSSYLACGRGLMLTDEITISVLAYMDDWSIYPTTNSHGRLISCTQTGGWAFEGNRTPAVMDFLVYANGAYRHARSEDPITDLSSGWHLITGTWNGYLSKIYIDGVKKGESSVLSTKTPISYNALNGVFIGAEAAGNQTTPNASDGYFVGKIANIKIYGTALSDEDIKDLYQNRIKIDSNGTIFSGHLTESSENEKIELIKENDLKVLGVSDLMILSDGSKWIPISVHNSNDGLCTALDKKCYYNSSSIWNNFGLINTAKRPDDNNYEFYVLNQLSNQTFRWYRFKQSINPFNATWADVNPSKVGTTVTRIDCTSGVTNNYAGMYWFQNTNSSSSNTAMCFANTTSSNWFGCGVTNNWNSGIPSYNGEAVIGWQIVYMRINDDFINNIRGNLTTNIVEV